MKGTREPPFPSRRRCAPSRTIPSYAYRPSHATLVSHSHGSDRVFLAGCGSGRGSRTAAVGAGAGRRGRVGPVLVERCILHSRCAFCIRDVQLKVPARVQNAHLGARGRAARPGGRGDRRGRRPRRARGGAGCPNLLQRPESRRGARAFQREGRGTWRGPLGASEGHAVSAGGAGDLGLQAGDRLAGRSRIDRRRVGDDPLHRPHHAAPGGVRGEQQVRGVPER